jgi:hypothetical protein
MQVLSNIEFEVLLSKELSSIDHEPSRTFIQSTLVTPYSKPLTWEYGNQEQFPAWVFADFKERNVGAVHCLGGHGALGSPWGLLFLPNNYFGQDSAWYSSLAALVHEWVAV